MSNRDSKKRRLEVADGETLLRLRDMSQRRCQQYKEKISHYISKLGCQKSLLNKLEAQLADNLRVQDETSPWIHLQTKRKLDLSSEMSETGPALEEKVPVKLPNEKLLLRISSQRKDTSSKIHDSLHSMGIGGLRQLDLFRSIGTSPIATRFNIESTNLINSQHMRNLKCLELCPTNDMMFATSGLDGVVTLWEVENKGTSAIRLGGMDCLSPYQKRWPEDIAWHPDGRRLFAVHSADGDDSQISSFSLTQLDSQRKAFFLEKRAHQNGIINRINFMPWRGQTSSFVTCGSDRSVILWKEGDKFGWWGQELLHRDQHKGAVTAAFGLSFNEAVLSVGSDMRVVLFDLVTGRDAFKFLLESECFNALPNPCNPNLYLVQLGSPEKHLLLFDIREKPKALHVFGWDRENSKSQSALTTPAFSPDGWHISSGSSDTLIHIFDIRYSSRRPSQSVDAQSHGVAKATWHRSLPLLISISDVHIGLHKYL